MVAILHCGDDIVDRLERRRTHREYSEAWRATSWPGPRAHLAVLVLDNGSIRWLGRAVSGKRVTSRDLTVQVTEIEQINPFPLERVKEEMDAQHTAEIRTTKVLSARAAEAFVAALRSLLPQHHDLIDRLSRPEETHLLEGPHAELLSQERDAVGMLLDIGLGGTGRKALREWTPPVADAPFLHGMRNYSALEDHLIGHDVERFLAWVQMPNVRVGWRTFTEGRRQIFIMNANRTAVESTLGVDVVYFNRSSRSFILVQYKKMRREPTRHGDSLFYRPDDNIDAELKRMARIDERCARTNGDFRLLPSACWMKLCEPDPNIVDPASLIKGMYFAREHFLELMATCKGPKGGTRIGYENAPRYLNNTMFTNLVADGWIGSSGPATKEIERLIRDSLETGHAVIVGVQGDDAVEK